VKLVRLRRPKAHVPSHMWNIDLMQIQQYYEKQVMLRGRHIQEGKGKERSEEVKMIDMLSTQE
jgi:hypothetical protein